MALIEHIEESPDQLHKKTWSFVYQYRANQLVLDSYKYEHRGSKRQVYKITALYEKLPLTPLKDKSKRIDISAIPLKGIAETVKERFIASLKVVTELDESGTR